MASLIHTEERAERLSVCTEQVELQGGRVFGGARPGKDTNRALRNDTEFAREMESAAGLGCNRYCEPEKFPTRDCGVSQQCPSGVASYNSACSQTCQMLAHRFARQRTPWRRYIHSDDVTTMMAILADGHVCQQPGPGRPFSIGRMGFCSVSTRSPCCRHFLTGFLDHKQRTG